jgi:6,7-dimethyl-8-ribityllumazine synthase
MTTDLSKYDANALPKPKVLAGQRYAIVVADWNPEVTYAMAQGAVDTFIKHGVHEEHILVQHVPGTVELTYAAARLLEQNYNAIIVIGCVVQGDTPHFDYVCQSVTQGVSTLNAKGITPVIFSVLTTLNMQQALDRAGGKLGNKGIEGAVTAIHMANL